jgi:ABC-2 type transport system permease protein/oleandomycin transport system permease protein
MSEHTLTSPAGIATGAVSPPLRQVSRGQLASIVVDSALLAKRSLMRVPRQPDWLFGATIQPVMFILLFRYVFAGAIPIPGTSSVDYIMSGIIVQGLVFGSINTAVGLSEDIKKGLMDRFRSLPMPRSSILLGRILADLMLQVFVTAISIGVALAVGFRPNANPAEWLGAIGLMALMAFTLSWIGAIIGLTLRSTEAVTSIGLVWIFPLTFASSAFVMPQTMPGWLEAFAKNQPVTLIIDAVRGLWTGYYPQASSHTALYAVIWLVAVCIVAIPTAIWAYERRMAN